MPHPMTTGLRSSGRTSRRDRCLASTLVAALSTIGIASASGAVPITLEFTATDFPPTFGGIEAPFDPVSGVIVYDAADVGSPIESLTSISLDIGSHSFTVGELSFSSSPSDISTSNLIGGALNGAGGVTTATDDFSLQYDRADPPGVGANFVYATSELSGIWRTTTFSSFSLEGPTPVAEPGISSLLLASWIGIAAARRRRVG